MFNVCLHAISLCDRPCGSFYHHILEVVPRESERSLRTHTGRVQHLYRVSISSRLPVEVYRSISGVERSLTPQLMSNPTPPGISPRIQLSECGHPADRKPISPVNIRHPQGIPDDSWQCRNIGESAELRLIQELLYNESERKNRPGTLIPGTVPAGTSHSVLPQSCYMLKHRIYHHTSKSMSNTYPSSPLTILRPEYDIPLISVPPRCRSGSKGSPTSKARMELLAI